MSPVGFQYTYSYCIPYLILTVFNENNLSLTSKQRYATTVPSDNSFKIVLMVHWILMGRIEHRTQFILKCVVLTRHRLWSGDSERYEWWKFKNLRYVRYIFIYSECVCVCVWKRKRKAVCAGECGKDERRENRARGGDWENRREELPPRHFSILPLWWEHISLVLWASSLSLTHTHSFALILSRQNVLSVCLAAFLISARF